MGTTSFLCELIFHGEKQQQILPLSCHVHKYTERFIYTEKIADTSVPIAYYESERLNSWRNLQIVDRTHLIPANTFDIISDSDRYVELTGTAISSPYKEIAITHVLGKNVNGNEVPLFFRHDLPQRTLDARIEIVENGAKINVDSGYLANVEENVIYTNYKNFFNPDTGAYKLHFVVSVNEDGETNRVLLAPEPVARQASWEDVDLETGKLQEEVPLWSREATSAGYTYYMNIGQTYYIKPIEGTTITPIKPSGTTPDDIWNIKFSNGEFYTYVNGKFRNYWLPEYDRQSFAPAKPYIFSPYRKMIWVNDNALAMTRKNLAVHPMSSMHATIYAYDEDDVLRAVWTTDGTKHEDRYSDTNIYYNSETIMAWDNEGGFFITDQDLDPAWQYYGTTFYEAKDYEYTTLTLNPLQNKKALELMWVYYMVPDADNDDKAIHTLGVSNDGIILYCSQELGRSYPNLQLLNNDNSYNENTVIGMKYRSEIDPNSFVKLYTAQYNNQHAYYILCEVLALETAIKEDSFVVDLRKEGGYINEDDFTDAIRANPKILQSFLGYGPDGQECAKNATVIIRAPLNLLEEYGGNLVESKVKELVAQRLNMTTYPVIQWEYPSSRIYGNSLQENIVKIYMTWEGPGLKYKIYKKDNIGEEWGDAYDEISQEERETIVWSDEDLESNNNYFYMVSIEKDGIEYPGSDTLEVMVM